MIKTRPLLTEVLQMIGYHNVRKKTHHINFPINYKELLEKYQLIWNKIKIS